MSLARYIAETFREHDTITVDAPWHPDGVTFRLRIRPDSDSAWCEARAKAGVPDPTTIDERRTAELEAQEATRRAEAKKALAAKGKKGGDIAAPLYDLIQRQAAEPSKLPRYETIAAEKWDIRYPLYTRAELEVLAPFVPIHLVAGVEQIAESGEVTEWTTDQIAETFREAREIPVAFPDAPDDTAELAGYPEGIAWAIVVLRDAVQAHKFAERRVPLASESSDSDPPPDTSEVEKTPSLSLELA